MLITSKLFRLIIFFFVYFWGYFTEMFQCFELRFYETEKKTIQKPDVLYKLLLCQEFKLQTTGILILV